MSDMKGISCGFNEFNFESAVKELNQKYKFRVEGNENDGTVTLITGYNDTDDYNSYFFGSFENMKRLGGLLIQTAEFVECRQKILIYSEENSKFIRDTIKNKKVENPVIHVKFFEPFTFNPNSSNFGKVILKVTIPDVANDLEIVSDNIVDYNIIDKLNIAKQDGYISEYSIDMKSFEYHKKLFMSISESHKSTKNPSTMNKIVPADIDSIVSHMMDIIDEKYK